MSAESVRVNRLESEGSGRRRGVVGRVALAVAVLVGVGAASAEQANDEATRQLLVAADRGRVAAVRAALGAGARIDEASERFAGSDRQPALVAAALRGHSEVVRVLLELGADPFAVEKDGYNVWHAAAFQGQVPVLRVLIERQTPGYGLHADGATPLHRACWGRTRRHAQAVRVLIEEGGRDCNEPDARGRTPRELSKNPQTLAVLRTCPVRSDAPPPAE